MTSNSDSTSSRISSLSDRLWIAGKAASDDARLLFRAHRAIELLAYYLEAAVAKTGGLTLEAGRGHESGNVEALCAAVPGLVVEGWDGRSVGKAPSGEGAADGD